MPTLEEIAELAGVSRSTVSRVINHDPKVREDTRQRVMDVIRRINYQPNTAARSLAGGRTNILGLVIPRGVSDIFTDPFFPILIQGVSSACNAHDYSVMLWLAEPEYERRMIHQILNNGLVDGVIIASALVDDPLVDALLERDMPFVMIGRPPGLANVSYIDVDNESSARQIVSHLLRLGRRRIAAISGPLSMVAGIDRLEGYKQAVRQAGLKLDPELVVESDFTEEGGYHAMQRLIHQKPDAVFSASDTMAVGALRALREAGLSVPEQVSVVGFDDLPFAARTTPPLTTVRQPTFKVGTTAVETLLAQIDHPETGPKRVLLPTELVLRDTCCAPFRNGLETRTNTN